jgi:amino acid transporter
VSDPVGDLTAGAALIVGWLLGTFYTLAVVRAVRRLVSEVPGRGGGDTPAEP